MSKRIENLELEVLVRDKSLADLRNQLKILKKDFDNARPNTPEFERYASQVRATKAEIAKLNSEITQSNARYFKLGTQIREVAAAGMKLYATFFALHKAFEFAEMAAEAEQSLSSFDKMVTKFGANTAQVLDDLQKRSAGIIDDSQLAQIATKALSLGVPVEKLGDLMTIARAKARDMGISVEEAFTVITEAIGRGRPMQLAQVGLAIRGTEAFDEYGNAVGESATNLSMAQRQQAVLNTVIEKGTEAANRHNLAVRTNIENIQRLRAQIEQLKEEIGAYLLRAQFFVIGLVGAVKTWFAALYTVGASVFALIERGLNLLGFSDSKFFQQLEKAGHKLIKQYGKEMTDAFKGTFASSKELAGGIRDVAQVTDQAAISAEKWSKAMERARKSSKELTDSARKSDLLLMAGLFGDDVAKEFEKRAKEREEERQIEARFGSEALARVKAAKGRRSLQVPKSEIKKVEGVSEKSAVDTIIADEQERAKESIEEFADIGQNIGYGFAQGVESGAPVIKAAFKSILREVLSYLEKQLIAARIGNLLKNFMTLGPAGIIKGVAEVAAITAAFTFAKSQILAYGEGGRITEPVFGVGRSGRRYLFGEKGEDEIVTPASRANEVGQSSRGSAVVSMLGRVERAIVDLQTRFQFEISGLDLVAAYRKNAAIVAERGM